MDAAKIIQKAKTSRFWLWVLNRGLDRMIPFNKPHAFRVVEITDTSIKTCIPYKRRNFNHIRGLHACALATLSEFTTGLTLINSLDPAKYRIIMQRFEMDYHYQGKMTAYANFEITDAWIDQEIYQPLQTSESVVVPCIVKIHDEKNNHLTTGKVFWQVKAWNKVRTKV
ncbi:MAG TPA: DUF4442 domain-containing protein [Cyclobacteriaceae bacterium]|nr:DUF4442 domain-containing protein [Cyclobacteriaceae bacterium]